MHKKLIKVASVCMALALTVSSAATLGNTASIKAQATTTTSVSTKSGSESSETKTPKYIFMFIGDGMSYPQLQLTNYYLSAQEDTNDNDILEAPNDNLSMLQLAVAGSAQTYDSTSFCPDSASTATSISTGHKTYSGTINMDETGTTSYETIAEKLKKQKGYEIGIVSSVNINHATPAAFYSHVASRNDYYDIALEMVNSDFDYFAGGGVKQATGENGDQKDIYELAAEKGYTVAKTKADAEKINADTEKALIIDENLADGDAMNYDMDLEDGQWALADYVSKGIEVLGNAENGFFMMCEGGKIDWACHANDAASTITDTVALDNAVKVALDFAKEHADETLIIVTGDHETGGLTIGYAGTDYDTFLTNISNQKLSYAKFDTDYVSKYKEEKTDFDTVMKDITELFGLQAPTSSEEKTSSKDSADKHPESEDTGSLVLTEYEYEKLKTAYETTMSRTGDEESFSQEEYVLYGSYEPLTVTITHLLNNKSGVNFASYAHTGLPVAVLVEGVGQDEFDGFYDNTEIYNKLAALTGVE